MGAKKKPTIYICIYGFLKEWDQQKINKNWESGGPESICGEEGLINQH